MDFTVLRSLMTLISFITFLGIIVWAFRKANQPAFDEAEMLPFMDEQGVVGAGSHNGSHS